ncbi:MAG: hypothetical protein OEY70_03205 [Acidimicrobiia bacterium]|nr:hypothetical protein [Acidimicrobiia bacterium]
MDQITHPPLRGRALRFILVDELMRRPEMTVAELVTALVHRTGFDLGGRASKIISDALRWETRRGRVVRIGRGRYRFSHAARSTTRRIGTLATRSRAWVVAIMRRPLDVTTPLVGVSTPSGAGRPPWADLRWLRNT